MSKTKLRILLYFSTILIVFLTVVLFLDITYYHNLEKTKYYLGKKNEIEEFDIVYKRLIPDNFEYSKLNVTNDNVYFSLLGFEDVLIESSNRNLFSNKKLHSTQVLALYSMGYLSDFFLTNYKKNNIGLKELKLIDKVYNTLYKEIVNPLSLNSTTINDHVISERLQFDMLYRSYLETYYPERKDMINKLTSDEKICIGFLMNDKYFTWQTNHGLMQIRSLAQAADVIITPENKNKLIDIVDERIANVLTYFIGGDGAIYEAAPEYWLGIYSFLNKIENLQIATQLSSIGELRKNLRKAEIFLNFVTANDGYTQGMGDSYSFFLTENPTIRTEKNRVFSYSNNLAGVNWSNDSTDFNLLFVSLNTPPNVHKLPEDLAVYLYLDAPFFVNSGTYSYNRSDERTKIASDEASQSTVFYEGQADGLKSDSSYVNFIETEKGFLFFGEKIYQDNQRIFRKVSLTDNTIKIKDKASVGDTLTTQFILSPDVKIDKETDYICKLTNKKNKTIEIEANSKLKFDSITYSPSPQVLSKTNRLFFEHVDSIEIAFVLEHDIFKNTELFAKNISTLESDRYNRSLLLKEKYRTKNRGSGSQQLKKILPQLLFLFVLLSALIETFFYLHSKKSIKKNALKSLD